MGENKKGIDGIFLNNDSTSIEKETTRNNDINGIFLTSKNTLKSRTTGKKTLKSRTTGKKTLKSRTTRQCKKRDTVFSLVTSTDIKKEN